MLALKNSNLEITFANPKKELKIKTKTALNDGQWHQVAQKYYANVNVTLKLDLL
jgi:predicted dinucleotide-utilizing enzyme